MIIIIKKRTATNTESIHINLIFPTNVSSKTTHVAGVGPSVWDSYSTKTFSYLQLVILIITMDIKHTGGTKCQLKFQKC